MPIGGQVLLMAGLALGASLVTAAPAQADFKIGFSNPAPTSRAMFKHRFGRTGRVATRRVLIEEGPATEETGAPASRPANLPERPRLHEAPGAPTDAAPPEVTVLRPIGRRIAEPAP